MNLQKLFINFINNEKKNKMSFVAVDGDGSEYVFTDYPERNELYDREYWLPSCDRYGECNDYVELPKGSIRKLIGRELTWEDEPVELKVE